MTQDNQVIAVVLAAGQGKRMHSDLPKVAHEIAGKPMVCHVLDAAAEAAGGGTPIVVFGHAGDQLQALLSARDITWVEQAEQLGTGHAVAQTLPSIEGDPLVLILYGDVPLLRSETLQELVAAASGSGFSLLTVELDDPTGYGRIVRDGSGAIQRIVEHKDASASELAIAEINTGIMVLRAAYLRTWLPKLNNANAQGEYYLTDCVEMAVAESIEVAGVIAESEEEVSGVNNRAQLATLERAYQRRCADRLLAAGVGLADPSRIDVRGTLKCGRDVYIDVNTVFVGDVTLGDGVSIGPNAVVSNARIDDGVEVLPNCVIEDASIGAGSRIGPFARIRPDAELASNVHIGNFVEIKKSSIGEGSKVNHLAYVGDTEIGKNVNVGAGTITCNYDGANKHKTVLEDDVFVGSDTQLVAPVRVGAGVTIGAGTTVTEDVPPGGLVISRVKQKVLSGWKRPQKKKT